MEVQDHNLLANATFVLPGQSAENLIQTCETYISFVESSKMPSPSDFGLAGLPWPTYHSHARPQPDRSLRRSSDPHSPLCDSTPVGAPPHHPRVSSGVGVQPWPRQGVAQGKKSEGTLVVRRSQARGQRQDGKRTTHQPPRESESRQTADRQNRQQPPHRSDTSAGESPTQRYAVVPPYRPMHQGGAFVRCPPYGI